MTDPTCYHDGGTCRLQDALDEACERAAVLEVALDRERTRRLQAEERVAELEDELLKLDDKTCDGNEPNCAGCHNCGPRRTEAMFAAEERVADLESLIAAHAATCDEACTGCGTLMMQRHKEPCPWRDAYLSHHARVTEPKRLKAALRDSVTAALTAREPVEGRDYERMPGVGE